MYMLSEHRFGQILHGVMITRKSLLQNGQTINKAICSFYLFFCGERQQPWGWWVGWGGSQQCWITQLHLSDCGSCLLCVIVSNCPGPRMAVFPSSRLTSAVDTELGPNLF